MKLATWNVNSLKVRLPQVQDWLIAHRPDALCLQETKLQDDNFPRAVLGRPVIFRFSAGRKPTTVLQFSAAPKRPGER